MYQAISILYSVYMLDKSCLYLGYILFISGYIFEQQSIRQSLEFKYEFKLRLEVVLELTRKLTGKIRVYRLQVYIPSEWVPILKEYERICGYRSLSDIVRSLIREYIIIPYLRKKKEREE